MVSIRIPKQYIDALTTIASIEENTYKIFLDVLKKYDCSNFGELADLSTLKSYLKSEITNSQIDYTELDNILEILVSIYGNLESSNISYTSLLDVITEDINQLVEAQEFDVNEDILISRLDDLLNSIEVFQITAKGRNLMAEYGKLYIKSRVVTDVRPIFPNSETSVSSISSALVVHNLKIVYQELEQRHEIFLAMDINDLKQLKREISRAIEKGELIKKTIQISNQEKE